jgi:hypothetical protein
MGKFLATYDQPRTGHDACPAPIRKIPDDLLFGSQGLSTSIRDTYHRVPQVDWLFFDKAYAQKVLMNRRSLWPSNETVALGVMPQ